MSNKSFVFHPVVFFIVIVLLSSCGNRNRTENKSITGKDSIVQILRDLDSKIADHPSDAGLYQQRTKYYLIDRQYEKALSDISKAISLDPQKAAYYITLSDVYLGMGKPDNANTALLKAINLDPRSNAALIRLAKLSLIM